MACKISHDFCISKGSDFLAKLELMNDDDTAMDLQGKTARLIVREINLEKSNIILDEECLIDGNNIELNLSHDLTDSVTQKKGYYNVFLIEEPTQKVKILEGVIEFKESLM